MDSTAYLDRVRLAPTTDEAALAVLDARDAGLPASALRGVSAAYQTRRQAEHEIDALVAGWDDPVAYLLHRAQVALGDAEATR